MPFSSRLRLAVPKRRSSGTPIRLRPTIGVPAHPMMRFRGAVVHSDDWGDGDAGLGHAPVTELVHSPRRLAWTCAAALAVSAVLIPLGQLWLGYITGVTAAALCMVTTVIDRQKRGSPNYVATPGLQVNQHVRMVRIAAFIVCLIHIIRLAQQAAQ